MKKSELFPALEDIVFAEKDPDVITYEIINTYEQLTDRTLSASDPVRLFLNSIILIIIQQRNLIDIASKQNLLAYATGSYLDHIGALLGVTRLEATHAACTMKFTLSKARDYAVNIPSGTRISAGDNIYFELIDDAVILPGENSTQCDALCQVSGTQGNGYVPGQINRLVDVFQYEVSAENITESYGGMDKEDDESFRERIHIAPESFSSAGPVKAYEYYARSADSDISSVAVIGPPETQPGHVNIYPLMNGGEIPSDEIIAKVYEACNAEDVRPDTDYVSVLKPVQVNYDLSLTYWIDSKNASGSGVIQSAIIKAVNEWVKWEKSELGRDINPSELSHRVVMAGAKRCEIDRPVFKKIEKNEVAVMTSSNIKYGGIEEG